MKAQIKEYLLAQGFTQDGDADLSAIAESMEQFIAQLPKPSASTPMPLVGLPNGVVLNIPKVGFIARKELNQYVVFLEGLPTGPVIGKEELEALEAYGILQVLKTPEKPAEVIKLVKDEK